jgi:hypothetical protein
LGLVIISFFFFMKFGYLNNPPGLLLWVSRV